MTFSNYDNLAEPPSYDRLLKAADAILYAESIPGKGTVAMWRDDSKPSREGFSSHELVEAMTFLRRLGLVSAEEADPHFRRHGPSK